jgi:hypothetical protein
MRLRSGLVAFAMALFSVLLFSDRGDAETCQRYPNSIVFDSPDYGAGCIDEGPGCTECITTASRGVKICYYTFFNEAVYCYYGGQFPDNQIG